MIASAMLQKSRLSRRDWGLAAAATTGAAALLESCRDSKSGPAAPPPTAAPPFYFDMHVDTPSRMVSEGLNLGDSLPYTCVDIPKMRAGGLHAAFFAVFAPARNITPAEAVQQGLRITGVIVEEVRRHPQDLLLAVSSSDVTRARSEGKIAILLGVEGGHMIDSSLEALRRLYGLGARYLGLTHSGKTPWAGAAEFPGEGPAGLTDFGRNVVREMNRLGMMVDLSHASDQAFYDAIAVSRSPVLNTHAACRSVANHPRNLTDDMLKALAGNGGVLGVAYYSGMLDDAHRARFPELAEIGRQRSEVRKRLAAPADRKRLSEELWNLNLAEVKLIGQPPLSRLVDHIEHAAKVAGVDHVGIGSDFDSIGLKLPAGLEHIGKTPNLISALQQRGFSAADIHKIMGGNMLRALQQAEAAATGLAHPPGGAGK